MLPRITHLVVSEAPFSFVYRLIQKMADECTQNTLWKQSINSTSVR
jgi:hypothetical protein